MFERDGFLNARIVDIATRAKVSYGAFYHYFDSKEQIFREVAEAQEDRLSAPPDPNGQPRPPGITPHEQIRRANQRYLERYRSEARLMGVIEQVSRYDAYVNAARHGEHEAVRGSVRAHDPAAAEPRRGRQPGESGNRL